MKYVYTAMLLHLAGTEISEANIIKVFNAVDIEYNDAKVTRLVSVIKDVDIDKLIVTKEIALAVTPVKEKVKEKSSDDKLEESVTTGLDNLFS